MSRSAVYLRYTLKLQAPAMVTTLSGDSNHPMTQPFITGNAVRGVLAGELLIQGYSADSIDFRRLILEDYVRFLHAYPVNGSVRSLPASIAYRKPKGFTGTKYHDLTAYTGRITAETEFNAGDDGDTIIDPIDIWPSSSLMRVDFPFIEFDGSETKGNKVRVDSRSHQQRDRVKGRSWKATNKDGGEVTHGSLFAYDYIEPDQLFLGLIQVIADSEKESHAIINTIKGILDHRQITFGRSRRAGYGGAAIISFDSIEQREAVWRDVQEIDIPAHSQFRAYFISNCIARDSLTGQLDPCAIQRLLIDKFGGEDVVRIERTFWDFETIGGFNRKWRIEVPQALSIKAGSILVLKSKKAISATILRQIEHDGIGERRIEGFGRIIFLKSSESMEISIAPADSMHRAMHLQLSEPPELIRFLQQRILDTAFSRLLDREVRRVLYGVRKIPTGSIIGRLRIPLRNGVAEIGLQTLRNWLEGDDSQDPHKLKSEARDKLRDCRFSNTNLFDWLKEHSISDSGTRLVSIECNKSMNQLGGNSHLAEDVAKSQGAVYSVQLIDAVLATLARLARQRESENET